MSENRSGAALFDARVWDAALETFGAVTQLTVTLYGTDERIVGGPVPSTPLFSFFESHGYTPSVLTECARQCLSQTEDRPAVIVEPAYGLAAVGTSLRLDGETVGAAVAGYALVDFCRTPAMQSLAREAGVPFNDLWEIARRQQPIPSRRLALHGQLLQVLGDSLLRENYRTHQYEEVAARLTKEMAAKDEFLAVLSHELRTPLTPILGWARILKTSGDDPAQRLKAADSIERNARLQLALVSDLLTLNQAIREKLRLEIGAHDLTVVVRTAVETMSGTAADNGIDLAITGGDEALPVDGDGVRLQQVFANILSNALKFTPRGGRVQVEIARTPDGAVVRVTDTGEGMEAAFLPLVFDMFRQQEEGIRRRHSGLGIGLTLVKRIVDLHGGTVGVESAGLGHGTQITVCLPVSSLALGDGRPAAALADARALEHLTILVVEDTEDTLEATRRMLEGRGARVSVARNGREALDAMEAGNPDIVLCDLRMPTMDGFEFLRELSRLRGRDRVPVVAVTGLANEADHRRTKAAGFDGHLDKPFDDSSLVSAVIDALERRRAS